MLTSVQLSGENLVMYYCLILISLKYHVIKNLEIKCETKYITSNTVLNIHSRLIITLSIFIQVTSIHKNINDAVYK